MTKQGDGTWLQEITNRLKYGYIKINKIAGNRLSDGTYEAAREGGNLIPVKDAVFEIFTADQAQRLPDLSLQLKPGAVPALTLKTDAAGNFVHRESDGAYQDAAGKGWKNLLTGSYVIREKSAPGGYLPAAGLHVFTVNWEESTQLPGTTEVWNMEEGGSKYFADEMCRAGVKLTKVDADDRSKLSGALFIIYDTAGTDDPMDDCAAAVLIEKDAAANPGIYELSGDAPEGMVLWNTNAQGLPYLKAGADGNPRLLAGNYYLEEKVAPAGYEAPKTKNFFTINSSADVILKNPAGNANNEFTNRKGKQSLLLRKSIHPGDETRVPADADQKAPGGFRFVLSGTPDKAGEIFDDRMVLTDSAGKAVFQDIPYGSYTLREEERPEGDPRKGIYRLAEQTNITVTQAGILAGGNLLEKDLISGDYYVPLSNQLKRGTITGAVQAAAPGKETALPGTAVGLYRDAAAAVPVTDPLGNPVTAAADKDGKVTFLSVPYGTYYLKELTVREPFRKDTAVKEAVLGGEADGSSISVTQPWKNEIYRAEVSLTKKDSTDLSGASLSGALFTVYGNEAPIQDKPIAYLTEDAVTGAYTLSNRRNGTILPAVTGKENLPCYVEEGGKAFLTAGNYYVKETEAPDYYRKDEKSYPLAVNAASDMTVIGIANVAGRNLFENVRVTSDVVLRKIYNVTDGGTVQSYGLGGAGFSLYRDAGCTMPYQVSLNGTMTPLVVKSDEGSAGRMPGTITLSDLPPGEYYLKETEVPAGLVAPAPGNAPIYRIVTDGNRSDTVITEVGGTPGTELTEITNTPDNDVVNTLLEVTLKSNDGRLLANASFAVFRNGILAVNGRTDSSGKLRMRGILPGTYTIRQMSSSEGYEPDQLQKEVKVESGQTYTLEVINYKPEQGKTDGKGGNNGGNGSGSAAAPQHVIRETPPQEKDPGLVSPQVLPKTGGMTGQVVLLVLSAVLIAAGVFQRKRGRKQNTALIIGAGAVLFAAAVIPLLLDYRSEKELVRTISQQMTNREKQESDGIREEKSTDSQDTASSEQSGIGMLSIPGIELEVPVREGVGSKELRTAVGHVPGTALPGEEGGNCAIAGHRNYSFGRFFNRLEEVKGGDLITMTLTDGITYYYEVTDTMVVEPEEVEVLEQTEETELTLITCTPMYLSTHRFIVKAKPLEE